MDDTGSPQQPEGQRVDKRWSNAAGIVLLTAFVEAVAWNTQFNASDWGTWLLFGAAFILPIWAITSVLGAWRRWEEEEISSRAWKALGWIIGIPIVLGIGIYAFSSVSDWFKTIPSWAGVIIILLVILVFQRAKD